MQTAQYLHFLKYWIHPLNCYSRELVPVICRHPPGRPRKQRGVPVQAPACPRFYTLDRSVAATKQLRSRLVEDILPMLRENLSTHEVVNEVYLQIFLEMDVTFRDETNDGN